MALNASFETASRSLGLTPQQAELLCAAMVPSAVGQIAADLLCERSSVSHLADRAAERGLVRRGSAPEDGRVSLIELTPEGRRLATQFIKDLEAQLEPLLAEWPPARRKAAASTLLELSAALEEVSVAVRST